jgi:DNA polymerase III epsilon subunit-like protein
VTPRWLISLLQRRPIAKDAPLHSLRFVVVDTELTSLDKRTNRLLSIGALAMDGGRIRLGEEFYRVVNPRVEIPAESILVHGLRPIDVAAADPPERVLEEFHAFLRDSVIVGHFVGIDTTVLRKEHRGKDASIDNPVLDTAAAHHWLEQQEHRLRGLEEVQGRYDLAFLAEKYGLEMHDAHHALYDAYLTAQLWQKLLVRLQNAGITTVRKALRVAKG